MNCLADSCTIYLIALLTITALPIETVAEPKTFKFASVHIIFAFRQMDSYLLELGKQQASHVAIVNHVDAHMPHIHTGIPPGDIKTEQEDF